MVQQLFSSISGTLLNATTVLIGGLLGTFLGSRLSLRFQDLMFGALGLFTIVIGIADALKTQNPLILLGSLFIGGLIGEALRIEERLNGMGNWLQKRLARHSSTFSEAFITSSLVFCVGPLTILGALVNGLNGDISQLAIKSLLDGFAALGFAASLGWGVLVSIGTILVYEGGLSLGAHAIKPILNTNPDMIVEMTAAGGLIIMGIGLKLLKIRDLPVANLLPALVIAPALVAIIGAITPLLAHVKV
jgi:uncharacterized membrane protein YqgA involved in biofilm formation